MRRLLAFLPAVLFVAVVVGFMLGLKRDPAILPSMLIGKPLPTFAAAGLRPGEAVLASADLAGEPMLLNIFASWCGPCKAEHPMLLHLQAQGVPMAGLDWKDAAADGARWLVENGDPFQRVGSDANGRIGIDLGVSGAPETFVIDRHGVVRYRQVGEITPEIWAKTIEPLMTKLKAES